MVRLIGCAPITIDVLSNDSDPENDALSIVSVNAGSLQFGSAMQSGNQITYQPANTCGKSNGGVENFSYTITDGNGNTASANVTVTLEGATFTGNTIAEMDDATGMGSYTETFYYNIVDANGYIDSAMIIIDVVNGCVAGSKCN